MSRMETVWVQPMAQWLETGHVLGSSDAERAVVWLVEIFEVLDDHYVGVYGRRTARKALSMREAAREVLQKARGVAAAEARERRIRLFYSLLDCDSYLVLESAHDLRKAKIVHLERLMEFHDHRTVQKKWGR